MFSSSRARRSIMNSKVQHLHVVLQSMPSGVTSLKASRPTLVREESSHGLQRPCSVFAACYSTAQRSLQCSFWKVGKSREGRQQRPAVQQASEANDVLRLSSLPLTLEVSQSLFGLNCARIRNDRAVISQSGWRRAAILPASLVL